MISGIGIDIIEIARIRKAIESNPGFAQRIFSPSEIEYCESKADSIVSYAARFAAKEAFMKALGTGWNHEVSWVEIETLTKENGKPELVISGRTKATLVSRHITSCHLSLSHEKGYAVANVVLESS
jgi:holo-[acyl-carrier protein] synthase